MRSAVGRFTPECEGARLVSSDNATVTPWGELMVCEGREEGVCHVHRVSLDGEVQPFVRNAFEGGNGEFAGVCFSPDGKVMFVNMQEAGLTLAITGPFPA